MGPWRARFRSTAGADQDPSAAVCRARDSASSERRRVKNSIWRDLLPPYGTIVADPPWRYRKSPQERGTTHARALVSDLYDTMSMRELADLPVGDLAAKDA